MSFTSFHHRNYDCPAKPRTQQNEKEIDEKKTQKFILAKKKKKKINIIHEKES